MSKENYNNQFIIAYLLGDLPEAEAERFDELSFTDDEFAGALDAAEKDLVDAYVRGELAGETLEKFESRYLASPLRRKKVEFAGAFQTFAARSVVENSKPEESPGSFFSVFNKNFLKLGFAFAALLLLILGGLWIIDNRRNQPTDETAARNTPKKSEENRAENIESTREIAANENNSSPQKAEKEDANKNAVASQNAQKPPLTPPKITVASFVLAPSLRGGGGQISDFSISKEIVSVAVRLRLEPNDYSSYRVALADESGSKTLWSSGVLRAAGKGESQSLNVQFPARLLKSQIYSLVVSGAKDGEAEVFGNYTFRVVIK